MINLKIKTASVKKLCKRVSFVSHCSQEEIVKDNRRNKNVTENKIKIIKNFNSHCCKGCNFNNNDNKRFISVMAEILKRVVKQENRINKTDKMWRKTKRTTVKNIVLIARKNQTFSKRSKINCNKNTL